MTWYKLAREDGYDFFTGHTIHYDVGAVIEAPDWNPSPHCGGGLHISQNPNDCFMGATIFCRAFIVLPEDLITIGAQKSKARRLTVQEECTDLDALFGWDYTGLRSFIGSMTSVPWLRPQGPPDKKWKHHVGESLVEAIAAASTAVIAAASTAASDDGSTASSHDAKMATWEAAWATTRASASFAASTAASETARVASWEAIWPAVGDLARMPTWEIASAAAGMAMLYVCAGLALGAEYDTLLRARWDVWQRGYGLLSDVNGVLYTYGVETKGGAS